MLPRALLLDLDGTLVDSEPIHRAAYASWLNSRGWSVPDLSIFTGRRAEDVFTTEPGPWTGLDPTALCAEVIEHLAADARPVPVAGTDELISAATRLGIALALVTSAGPAWVEISLGEVLKVREHFVTTVTAQDVVDGKPDPAGYLLAAERIGVPPAQCWVIEDSPAGIKAARRAGVGRVIGVASTHPVEVLLATGADEAAGDLRTIPRQWAR